MSYIALARKYRPNNFKELVGQNVLTTTLANGIKENRIHHAFLLTGIRGVGKTTTARIIAKNLNCSNGLTSNPCETCENCIAIKNGNHPDVIEFDAASNTGIEDVKIIISNTHYAPIMGRKKVFIIDEVHMLSTKAFNALLKTLEEPPENIIFIFATTEVRKVPITILSRCQKFFLKAISVPEIVSNLKDILKKEGYEAVEKALLLIAKKADGSMRDALSILDQAILQAEGNMIYEEEVNEMLKIPSEDEVLELFNFIAYNDLENANKKLEELLNAGMEEMEILHSLLEACYSKIKDESLGKKALGMPFLLRINQLIECFMEDFKNFSNKKIALEVLLIKLCYFSSLPTPEELIERIKSTELNSVLSKLEGSKLIS